MSRTAIFSKQVISDAQLNLQNATTIPEFRRAQVILLPANLGLTKAQTAAAIGLSPSRVGAIQVEVRHPAAAPKASHGGRRRQRMTFAAEVAFLEPWRQAAETAGMIIVPPLRAALAKQLGKKVHHSQVYRMLARHGWRKAAPDSKPPKRDPEVQEAWKKNSRTWWPNSSKVQMQRARSPLDVPGRSPLWPHVTAPPRLGSGWHTADDAQWLRAGIHPRLWSRESRGRNAGLLPVRENEPCGNGRFPQAGQPTVS